MIASPTRVSVDTVDSNVMYLLLGRIFLGAQVLDIGCPKVKTTNALVVQRPGLGGDSARNLVNLIKYLSNKLWDILLPWTY